MVNSFKRTLKILVMVVAALALIVQTADARRWAFGDDRRWMVMRACRDGAILLAFNDQSEDPTFEPDPDNNAINLQARYYSNPAAPPPSLDDGTLDGNPEDYGELILGDIDVPLEKHSAPLSADEDEDGVIEDFENFYVYTIAVVQWAPLDVSAGPQKIIVIHNGLNTGSVAYAGDCSLEDLYFFEGSPAVIAQSRLDLDEPGLQPENIYYMLQTPPSFGDLELDGAPLAGGDIFTQADVNAGRIEYVPDSPDQPQADYFAAARHGVVRSSAGLDGSDPDGDSYMPSISADGRYVAFASQAANLVSGDENNLCDNDFDEVFEENCADIFVYDQATGQMLLVSASSDGAQGNGPSDLPAISGDGAWVAYRSSADNLVGGTGDLCESALADTNRASDVFLSRVAFSDTLRYSTGPRVDGLCTEGNAGVFGLDITLDGMVVGFSSLASNMNGSVDDSNGLPDVFLHGYDELVGSQTYVASQQPGIPSTGNGSSGALPLGPGDYTAREVSLSDEPGTLPALAFASDASNLVSGDNNFLSDIFLLTKAGLKRIPLNSDGDEANGASYTPSISADGRWVAFVSEATNLDFRDTNNLPDVYVHDRDVDGNGIFDEQDGTSVQLVSRSFDFNGSSSFTPAANGAASYPSISPDGRYIAFASDTTDLVANDPNNLTDVFMVDRDADGNGVYGVSDDSFIDRTWTYSISTSFDFQLGDGFSTWPSVSRDGKFVAYTTLAGNLLPGQDDPLVDVYTYYPGDLVIFPLLFTEAPLEPAGIYLHLPMLVR